jgi:predicted Zn-dependent protease with MMP-like domain
MNAKLRQLFDSELETVLAEAPQQVRDLLDKVPLVVEDYPSRAVMRRTRVRRRSALCGLYTGIPLIHRSVEQWGVPSDVIHIYREGILSLSRKRDGAISLPKLRRQIRVTILHELGHHHGMTERELGELGYG